MVSGLHVKTESVQSFCNSVFAFPDFLWSPRSLTLLHVFLELLPELVNERIGFLHKFFEDILQFLSSNRDIAPVRALDGVFQHLHGGERGANVELRGHGR